ncbi:nucleoside-diphosphate-sugar epimerase [Pedobacter cryoconitis]|uniref:Nucleoside-diphosphate-sugar epimerase n=2 Tax=Pedobacter cryoconitis TaxID=188932 RepID=A0A7W8YWX7_9SPHI|nr:NAD-dependent epimerase/dehydratase family protein [Pedobacter cryoconitis]MBB5623326.1 nucleoside-diphosphate-sugar epimerase [Pedobacter cryoconitis]MBB5646700.1 nucleoside-diphosphate-sugar epimerase [Pedobacter cryoconitis]
MNMLKENNQILILVTGGTGFAGIHAFHQLLQKGYQVCFIALAGGTMPLPESLLKCNL